MLRKLKIKFIIVIMIIVTILFAAIFGCVMHLTKRNLERESIQMMQSMLFQPMHSEPPLHMPEKAPDSIRLPFFTVVIEDDGKINAFGGGYYNLSDEDLLSNIVDAALSQDEHSGIIHEYNLRYLKDNFSDSQRIVFADVSTEKAMIKGLIRNCIIIGLIGYIIFFFISLILARWVTKPVEKTWNGQKQFIADASHELKTPLTIIMTNSEMLQDKSYNEDDKSKFTKNILSMSKRMRGLVESLLELARLDNGTAGSECKLLDYSRIVSNNVLPFEPMFFENDIGLDCDIQRDIQIMGDKLRLGQVVDILLDNAMKYSEVNSTVKIALKREGTHCILSVSSKGKPLSKEECRNIFKRFYRVDTARNDGQSYGLGLSIAESIMKEHGGKIWAESEGGHNVFYVSMMMVTKGIRT